MTEPDMKPVELCRHVTPRVRALCGRAGHFVKGDDAHLAVCRGKAVLQDSAKIR